MNQSLLILDLFCAITVEQWSYDHTGTSCFVNKTKSHHKSTNCFLTRFASQALPISNSPRSKRFRSFIRGADRMETISLCTLSACF